MSGIMHNREIKILIAVFLIAKLILIGFHSNIWWDSAVYIGMGKYIYSLGNAGLWEPSRPVIWPLILGFPWKLDFNPIAAGKALEALFGSLCILFTYLIGKKLFDKKIALLSSIFLALSPTFFFFNGLLLTEISSTAIALFAIYLFINKKYIASGIFFGLSFMARFLQLFAFFGILLVMIPNFNLKNKKTLAKITAGFFIPVILYVIFNIMLYNNPVFPFLQQILLSNNSGWQNYHSLTYYFIELFKENILYLFFIPGAIFALRRNAHKRLIAATFIAFFIFFSSIKQKEMRFLIVLLPYMYLLISSSVFYMLNHFKRSHLKPIFYIALIVSLALSLNSTYAYYNNEFKKGNQYAVFQDKLEIISPSSKIWVSSPVMAAYSDIGVSKLMYYPIFNKEISNNLIKNYEAADYIFLDTCDLACRPSDAECQISKDELIKFFRQRLQTEYSAIGECSQFIFKK